MADHKQLAFVSRRRFLKGIGAAGGALTLSGPMVFRGMAQPPQVPVGALFAFTGGLSEFGPNFERAAQLAVDHINNAANQVFGGPIMRLVVEDTATAPSQGVDRANSLVNQEGVPAIIGALSSGVSQAVGESVTVDANVLQISPASTSPVFSGPPFDETFFRTTVTDVQQGVVAAMLARGEVVDGYSNDTASVMYTNNAYGQGLNDVFAAAFERRDGTVQAQVPHQAGTPEPTYVDDLEQALADNPDIIMTPSYPGASTVFMQEALEQFDFTGFQHTDGTQSEDNIDAVGIENLMGQHGTAPGSPDSREAFQMFDSMYAERYGRTPPLPFMAQCYDAAFIVGLTIAKAISDGVDVTGPNLIDRIREVSNSPGETVSVGPEGSQAALEGIDGGDDIDYSGASGEQNFNDVGDVAGAGIQVWRYGEDGIENVTTVVDVPSE